MAHTVKEPPQHSVVHARREELIRPERVRREFPKREAQRRLQKKESRWAPIAYGVFAGAVLIIFCIAYIAYAFSEYRGEILPGVKVDNVSLGGLTTAKAAQVINNREAAIGRSPVRLVYRVLEWDPAPAQIGFGYRPKVTAKNALNVGRTENFVSQLVDRLPIHPTHEVPLVYSVNETKLRQYIQSAIVPKLHAPTVNAHIILNATHDDFVLQPSRDGLDLDFAAAEDTIHSILGSLTKQTRTLKVNRIHPAITSAVAEQFLARVKRFLAATPVIGVGKRVFASPRAPFVHMISFVDKVGKNQATVQMNVDGTAVRNYVASLAAQIDQPAQNATFDFSGGAVRVIKPRRTGRTLDEDAAYAAILKAVQTLTPRAQIHLKVTVTQPPVDDNNPASLGISTLIGTGSTSFAGAGPTRVADIQALAKWLNNTLVSPTQDISFNTIMGTNWPDRMYDDQEQSVNGQLVPADHGAMQQVATTFLRAMYDAGMRVEERHAHPYRLRWYEPPVGLDAVVDPGRNEDLRFANSAHRHLLIEVQVQPIRQQLIVYVYGPQLKWKVSVDRVGKVLRTIPHGPAITRQDPSLPPGAVQQTAWAHNGAVTVVQRTITYPNGHVASDEIDTTYQPWQAIMSVGATPNPTPQPRRSGGTPTPGPTGTPQPTPTPTFSH